MKFANKYWAAAALLAVAAVSQPAMAGKIGKNGAVSGPDRPSVSTSASCSPTRIKLRTESQFTSTSSTAFTTVPKSRILFKQGGNKSSCVIVRVSGEASTSASNDVMFLQVLLDGQTIAQPGGLMQFADGSGSVSVAHALDFVLPSVPPGKHKIVVRFSSNIGQPVYFSARTVIVQYK